MFRQMSLSIKLSILFTLVSILSVALVGISLTLGTKSILENGALEKLRAGQDSLTFQVEAQIDTYVDQLIILSTNASVKESLLEFSKDFEALNSNGQSAMNILDRLYASGNSYPLGERQNLIQATDGSAYSDTHAKWHGYYDLLIHRAGLYDVFLINNDGELVYTWAKEADYATNLLQGRWSDTGLGHVTRDALTLSDGGKNQTVATASFAPYAPSSGALASFFAAPVFDENGTRIGVLAIQASLDVFFQILNRDTGLGVPTSAYLLNENEMSVVVAGLEPDHPHAASDFWTGSSIAVDAVENGLSGSAITKFDNSELAVGFGPINIHGLTYGVLLEASYHDLLLGSRIMARNSFLIGLVVAAIVACVGVFFARAQVLPLVHVSSELDTLAEKRDLTLRIAHNTKPDEIGNSARAVDRLINFFDKTLLRVKESTEELFQTADSLQKSASALSHDSEAQSAAVEQLSALAEQTTQQVSSNAETAITSNKVVNETTIVVDEGINKFSRMVNAMDAINKSSQDIAAIIKVIDEIAFQTNLLALNAAVEAARAGQHGRGFAVVAQEVRNLAGRSAKAARETANLIDESRGRVTEGVSITEETQQAFSEIATNIRTVHEQVNAIAAASNEQATGIKQINDAIMEISNIANRNTHKSEILANTANSLGQTNDRLKGEIGQFRLSSA